MSDAIKKLHDYLAKSPSVVYPQDVLEFLPAIKAENDKLRELLIDAYKDMDAWQMVIANSDQWGYGKGCLERLYKLREAMRELRVEVGDGQRRDV